MQTVNKPFSIEVLGNGNGAKRGTTIQRQVIVKNTGDRSAEVDLWIAAVDSTSEPVLRWCTFNKPNPLSIEADRQEMVELRFEIPPDATPALYHYEILVDAQSQYPDKIERRPQQLRVLPADQDTTIDQTPVFSLHPATRSTDPAVLQAEESLTVIIRVENRSKRVDRFYVTCLEFDQTWISVRYPDGLETTGLGRETDGLELNPGQSGQITLIVHPPRYTPAGHYFPTVRLTSSISDDLVLLDVVYLQILPDERLDVRLHPPSRQVPREPEAFTIDLRNPGNINRQLSLQAGDRERLFRYTLNPFIVKLSPGEQQTIDLILKSKKWWRRPWRGKGLEIPFAIELANLKQLDPSPPALPQEMPQGTIVWQAHPWWRRLLLILLALGSLGAIAYLIWFHFFHKAPPPPTPKILSVENTNDPRTNQKKDYQEGYGDAIRLDWQISHLDQIEKVVLVRLENNVETDRKTFYLGGTIPAPLQQKGQSNYCKPTELEDSKQPETKINAVNCIGMITSAQKAGNYTFELQVFAKQQDLSQPVGTLKTDTIVINPALPPKIVEFSATKPSYSEAQVGTAPSKLPSVNIPASPAVSANPLPAPRPVLPLTAGLIRLNWEINSFSQIQEVRVIGLAADGSIGSPLKRYLFVDGRLPAELQPYCVQTTRLICQNVPTDAAKPGDYTFKLTVIPKQASSSEITKATEVIKIIPQTLSPSDIVFSVDGQSVDQTPKFVYEVSPNRPPIEISLSWNVKQAEGLKVELLPAPGGVKLNDTLKFPLGQSSSSETLTLKVTTRSGEQLSKSVVIQTVELKPVPNPAAGTSRVTVPNSASSNRSSTPELPSPTPSDPTRLSPIELPPRP